MKNFHQAFLWRLALACCLLTVLIVIGGHLASVGHISRLDGPHLGTRVTLIALSSGLATALLLYPLFANLHKQISRFADDVVTANLELAEVMGVVIAKRDSDTGSHNFRVTLYAFELAEVVDDEHVDIMALLLGAFLHDVGKVGIRDSILLKPGRLTEEEMDVMRTHVDLGLEIIASSTWLQQSRNVIEGHHERVDGTGYPRGLNGTDIPIEAKIFAIVDVFDALTSDRPYKKAMELDQALSEMRKSVGSHFDVDLFWKFNSIAKNSYQKFHAANEPELKEMLSSLVKRHRKNLYDIKHIDRTIFDEKSKSQSRQRGSFLDWTFLTEAIVGSFRCINVHIQSIARFHF